ncbi:MAG: PKD domain-containing protein, partial [Cyclobacteriaceae bacterium]
MLENTSVADSYGWDFCHTDLASSPSVNVIETINATNSPEVIKLVHDSSNWYGFVASRLSDEVFRLDYGSSLDSVPSVSSLGDLGMTALRPNAIDIINDSGIWYAIVLNQGGVFFRLTFANGLSGEFTVEDLGDLGSWQFVHDVKIIQVNEDFIVSVADGNGDKITMINFGNSISNGPIDQLDIGLSELDITNTYGIDFVETASGWYGFAADIGSDKVIRMDFGNDLMSEPEYTTLFAVANPTKVRVVKEGLTYTGIVMSQTGGLYRMNFGVDVTDYVDFEPLGNFSGILGRHNSFDLVKSGATWRGFTLDYQSNELIGIDFEGDCATEMSMNASTAEEPTGLYYNLGGEYLVELSAFDEHGNINILEDTILILNSSAPEIQISVDESRCILNENHFDIISSDDIQSYDWDFDGDGIVDVSGSTLETINYQFPRSGTFNIYLSVVSTAGCGNSVSVPITIYDEPPAPSFTIPSSACTNSSLTFINDTDISGFEGGVEFDWTVDNQLFEGQDLEYFFNDPGTYEIALISKVPGCESMPFTAVFDVIAGPDVDFDWSNNCFGEAVSFMNLTTEATVSSFEWDFGDGTVSSLENPSHQYLSAGEYVVSLEVENDQGCSTVYTRTIEVSDMGLAEFVQVDSIENLPIRINGLDKTLTGDSVINWSWDFGEFGDVNGKSVEINFFKSPGDYSVQLVVQTAQGCEYTLDSLIKVYDAPSPTIEVSYPSVFCKGEDVNISNKTVNGSKYYWDFCLEDLNTVDHVTSQIELDLASSLEDLKIVYDRGLYYGFASSRLTDEIIRLTFNKSLDSVKSLEYLDVLGGEVLSRPGAIELTQEGDHWFAFVSNSNDQLLRLNFDDGPSGDGSVTNFGNIGVWSYIQKLELVETEEGKILFVVDGNGSKVSVLNFENSVQNSPTIVHQITDSEIQNPYSIRLVSFEASYFAFLVDLGTDQILKLNFGESLLNAPTISSVGAVQNPTDIAIEQIAGNYIGYVTQQTKGLLKIDLGIDLNIYDFSDLGTYDGLLSNVNSFELIRTPYSWRAFVLNFSTNQLVGINFLEDCDESEVAYTRSDTFEPIGLRHYKSGVKPFLLTAEDESGNRSYLLDYLTISADSVSVFSFSPDQNLCIANSTIWTSEIAEGNVATYSWDLDGDGLEDSSDPNPTFQYASPGVYDIRLDVVSDAGC